MNEFENTQYKDAYREQIKNNPFINAIDWNAKAQEIYKNNHHWWFDVDGNPTNRPIRVLSMLIKSELAEALEGERKELKDDHLPQYFMYDVELADALIRILDEGAGLGYTIKPSDWLIDFDEDEDYSDIPEAQDHKISALDALTDQVSHLTNWLLNREYPERYISGSPTEAAETMTYYIEEAYGCLVTSILNVAAKWNVDIINVMEAKLEYNKNRADHKIENRMKAGGKKL